MSWLTKALGYAEQEPVKVISETAGWLRTEMVAGEAEAAHLVSRFKAVKAEVIVEVDDLVAAARASVDKFIALAQAKTTEAEQLAASIALQTETRVQRLAEAAQASNLAQGLQAVIEQHAPTVMPVDQAVAVVNKTAADLKAPVA